MTQDMEKSFYITQNNGLASLSLTNLSSIGVEANELLEEPIEKIDNLWYLNRLIVAKQLRGKGMAKKLLTMMSEWADSTQASVVLELNPYGDLNKEQLRELYKKFGFVDIKPMMLRRCNPK